MDDNKKVRVIEDLYINENCYKSLDECLVFLDKRSIFFYPLWPWPPMAKPLLLPEADPFCSKCWNTILDPDFPDFDLGYYYRVPCADVVV